MFDPEKKVDSFHHKYLMWTIIYNFFYTTTIYLQTLINSTEKFSFSINGRHSQNQVSNYTSSPHDIIFVHLLVYK